MPKILLIEDHSNQRMLYQQELEEEGYEVLSARNGEEGWLLFQKHHPDLAILDVILPDMDGIGLMERMLSADPHVPIIVHSAYSSPRHDYVTWYARAYVVKSGDLTELKEQVRLALAVEEALPAQRAGGVSA